MNAAIEKEPSPNTQELLRALEGLLDGPAKGARTIRHLDRQIFPYSSSFPLEKLIVRFVNGEQLEILFKNLSVGSPVSISQRIRPQFLFNPLREIEIYRSILDSATIGTAHYYGSVADDLRLKYWLFLENIRGRELYQCGEIEIW